MSTEGPNLAGTGSDYAAGDTPWVNPGNITAADSTNATALILASLTSEYLVGTNFGFALAGGSLVTGIEVIWKRNQDSIGTGNIIDNHVRLWDAGGLTGDDLSVGDNWFLDPGYENKSFGGSAITWGLTLTDTEVNLSTFGCAIQCKESSGGGANTARVDSVTMTITYSAGGSIYRIAKSRHVRRLTEHANLDTY